MPRCCVREIIAGVDKGMYERASSAVADAARPYVSMVQRSTSMEGRGIGMAMINPMEKVGGFGRTRRLKVGLQCLPC